MKRWDVEEWMGNLEQGLWKGKRRWDPEYFWETAWLLKRRKDSSLVWDRRASEDEVGLGLLVVWGLYRWESSCIRLNQRSRFNRERKEGKERLIDRKEFTCMMVGQLQNPKDRRRGRAGWNSQARAETPTGGISSESGKLQFSSLVSAMIESRITFLTKGQLITGFNHC